MAGPVYVSSAGAQMPTNSAQYQQIIDSFSSEIWVNNRLDVQHEPLWDTVSITTGNVLSTLTSALYSAVGPGNAKTPAQTNLTQPNKLPAPEAFSIYGFRFRYTENISILDIYNLINGFCFQFIVGNKAYNTGPLWFYNAGGGIYGLATSTATTILNNGMPGRSDMHRLAINIVLENQAYFAGQLLGNNYTVLGANGIVYEMLLDGLHARGVQ